MQSALSLARIPVRTSLGHGVAPVLNLVMMLDRTAERSAEVVLPLERPGSSYDMSERLIRKLVLQDCARALLRGVLRGNFISIRFWQNDRMRLWQSACVAPGRWMRACPLSGHAMFMSSASTLSRNSCRKPTNLEKNARKGGVEIGSEHPMSGCLNLEAAFIHLKKNRS